MTRLNPTLTAGQNVLTLDGEFGTVREIRTRGWVAVEIAGTIVNRRAKDLVATELEPMVQEPALPVAAVGASELARRIMNDEPVDPTIPAAAVGATSLAATSLAATSLAATSLAAAILNGTDRQPLPAEKARSSQSDGETLINTERRNGIVPATYLERYQRYTRQDETGAKVRSVDNGDAVARAFREMDLDAGYEYVAATLGTTPEALRAQYGHLNRGQQRMNIGNRLRAFLRRQAAAAIAANA